MNKITFQNCFDSAHSNEFPVLENFLIGNINSMNGFDADLLLNVSNKIVRFANYGGCPMEWEDDKIFLCINQA